MTKRKKKIKKVDYTISHSGIITLHLDPKDSRTRNEMHFQVQLSNKAQVFKDRTKYTRKKKHKNKYED